MTLLFGAVPVAMYVLRPDDSAQVKTMRIVFANRASEELFGYAASDVTGKLLSEVYPTTGPLGYAEQCWQTIVDQVPHDFAVISLSDIDGDERILNVSIFPLGTEHCVAIVDNLSARDTRRADLSAIVEASVDAILSWDLNGTILSWNSAAEKMFGASSVEMIGRDWADLMPSERAHEFGAMIDRLKAGSSMDTYERHRDGRDGVRIDFSVSISPLTDSAGRLVGVATILRDIGRRKKAESRLQLHTAMVFSSLNAIVGEDFNEVITAWNPSAERFFGYSADEMIGRRMDDLGQRFLNNQYVTLKGLREKVRRGEYVSPQELQVQRKDGSWIDVLRVMAPILDGKGVPVGFINSMRDLTDQRQLEQQLRQTQKMEAVGRLSGGIAHDFNNMLLVIRGYSAHLAKSIDDEELLEDLRHIDRAAERGAEFTRQLLAFGREQILRPESIDIKEAVEEEIAFLRPMLGTDIAITCELSDDAGNVLFDRGQLEQVILNLAVNARDAMPGGGVLSIKIARVELDESHARRHEGATTGPHVLLQIRDSGVGMDTETQRRIFDPFFTTKTDGTGLGLATVYGIMKQSGGHVWVYSELGMGATFKLYLPVAGVVALKPSAPPRSASLLGEETVLLVDDTDAVRALVKRTLESFGYTVIEAASGAEAIEASLTHGDNIRLLVTDVVMPQMNGRELAEALLVRLPDLKVLFTSGYPADAVIRGEIAHASANFLEKPYHMDDLASAVRATLDS